MLRLVLAYLTFPGVIVHEFAHAWACARLGIRVEEVCYLRFGNPMGYVRHERPSSTLRYIMAAVAPFFVATLMAVLFSLCACLLAGSRLPPETRDTVTLLAAWLSFSIALHAFPSPGDADALWQDVNEPGIGLMANLMLLPVIGLIRLCQLGSNCFLDVLFALGVVALPAAALLVLSGG
jgi:hypothetical protein